MNTFRIIETKVYTIDNHPNKDKVYEWIRNHWHGLADHCLQEVVDSLEALKERIGGKLDYSISVVPSRGEFITLTEYDREELCRLSSEDCPLTGVCYDIDVIQGLRNHNIEKVLTVLHSEHDHLYSDEGLYDLCVSNGYEFDEEGKIH